jgi:hypothetical protein
MAVARRTEAETAGSSDDPKLVLDVARAAISQEFQIAERLDAKSRNQIAVGGALFALVQAVASIAITHAVDNGDTRFTFGLLVATAAFAGLSLIVAAVFAYDVWRLRDEQEITPQALEEMAAASRDPKRELMDELVRHYEFILQTRRVNNRKRASAFDRSILPWMISLGLGTAELVTALIVLAH